MMLFLLTSIISGAATTSAAELLSRTVFIGSSFANDTTYHTFSFRHRNTSSVGSMGFLYCVNSPIEEDPCTAPVGLNVNGFTIGSQSGITGFSKSTISTSNEAVLNRATTSETPKNSSYRLNSIVNPSIANETVFVRISLYDGANKTGTKVDQGSVAFVVDERFELQAYVPPYLTFCTGIQVAIDCSSTNGFLSSFGELSPQRTASATSQFSVATNDPDGYNTFITGQTLTSGNNIIQPMSAPASSATGSSQFGLNLRSNSSPSVGSNPDSGPVGSGLPDSRYNTPNQYRFVNGERIATAPISTGFNRFTVSYIVNVPNRQPPGVYATSLVYTAIATF